MKTALRVVVLILTALMGLWLLGHGIILGVSAHLGTAGDGDVVSLLLEGSVFIAGGICVVSVAVQQLYCWRTHRKDGGLI